MLNFGSPIIIYLCQVLTFDYFDRHGKIILREELEKILVKEKTEELESWTTTKMKLMVKPKRRKSHAIGEF